MFGNKRAAVWGSGITLLIAVIAIGWIWWQRASVSVYTVEVTRQAVDRFVDERGVTSLPHRHVVSTPYTARVAQISLREGDTVEAGQEVARLVDEDVELEVAQAKAAMDRIRASLVENADVSLELTARKQAELYAEVTEANVKASEYQKEAATSWAAYWEQAAERARRLAQQSAQTIEELQLAEANESSKRAELSQQEFQVQSQRILAQAVQLVPQMVIDYLHRKRLQGAVLEQQLVEAELILRDRELRQQRARLTSPVRGVILRRETFSEQFLPGGTALLEIGNLDDLEIEAEILSQEAGPIRVGNRVEVYGPTLGRDLGEGLRGTVHRIHPDAFTKISSLGVEQQRVRVVIRLDEEGMKLCQSLGIGIGYRVRVRIVTESRDQVLSVPRSSVFRNDDGGWSLLVVRDGRLVEQAVAVGIMNDDWVEIDSGVAESEAVVLAPDSNLREGDRVRSIPSAVFRRGRPADE